MADWPVKAYLQRRFNNQRSHSLRREREENIRNIDWDKLFDMGSDKDAGETWKFIIFCYYNYNEN